MERPARPFTRREVLALIASALAGSVAYGGSALALAADATPTPSQSATFTAFCDTLIPADAISPSASGLGVPARILAEVQANAQLQRLVGFSCAWLDQAAGGDFARADEGLRNGILEAMSALPWEAPQRRFFDLMRDLAMGYFYSQPAALAGMATDQPPQPAGYFASLQ
jgi:hypothetical protein